MFSKRKTREIPPRKEVDKPDPFDPVNWYLDGTIPPDTNTSNSSTNTHSQPISQILSTHASNLNSKPKHTFMHASPPLHISKGLLNTKPGKLAMKRSIAEDCSDERQNRKKLLICLAQPSERKGIHHTGTTSKSNDRKIVRPAGTDPKPERSASRNNRSATPLPGVLSPTLKEYLLREHLSREQASLTEEHKKYLGDYELDSNGSPIRHMPPFAEFGPDDVMHRTSIFPPSGKISQQALLQAS